jgi:4-hydroxy-tetrahydrodipicolinate synthase
MLNGSIVALATPFTEHGEIDSSALDRLVDFHLANETDGLVIAGTTGESATLSGSEFADLLTRVVQRVDGRIPVIAGTGSASTASAVAQTRLAGSRGADAALVVTPYYNKPTQAGLKAHYTAVADASEIPLILYNVPSRTAVDMLPETVERLAGHGRIAGIKEAVPSAARIEELCARCGPDFAVLSGDDGSCLDSMRQGAAGVVSVAANVAPALMHALCMAAAQLDWEEAARLNKKLETLYRVLMIETNPIPVKWALFEMGLIGPHIRLPMTRLSESCHEAVRNGLAELDLVPAA